MTENEVAMEMAGAGATLAKAMREHLESDGYKRVRNKVLRRALEEYEAKVASLDAQEHEEACSDVGGAQTT